jgi:hypothetical protein
VCHVQGLVSGEYSGLSPGIRAGCWRVLGCVRYKGWFLESPRVCLQVRGQVSGESSGVTGIRVGFCRVLGYRYKNAGGESSSPGTKALAESPNLQVQRRWRRVLGSRYKGTGGESSAPGTKAVAESPRLQVHRSGRESSAPCKKALLENPWLQVQRRWRRDLGSRCKGAGRESSAPGTKVLAESPRLQVQRCWRRVLSSRYKGAGEELVELTELA